MKKITFFLMALLVSLASFAQATVPTNAELWEAFKPYYNTFYGEARADQPITLVATFMTQGEKIFTDATSEYKWLGDYLVKVATEQGFTINSEALWRWHADAFFQANQHTDWPKSADFTEAGKPENWGPYYLAAQEGTTPEPEPTTETVYFINTKKWSAVKAHVWGGKAAESAWPGKATVKETEKVAGYDVYSFTANVGDYANIIFNNNNGGSQTSDLVWTAGKYYVIDMGWLTKEEAETKLAAPLPETWNIVGDAGLMGKGWDLNAAENAMTQQGDGTYLLEKKDITITAGTYEYKAAKDHGWTVAVPQDGNQKLTISKSGIYDITFVLNVTAKTLKATATLKKEAVVIPDVIIAGDMNSWNQTKDKFTMSADSLTATFKATLAVKNYGFKMIVGGAWLSDGKTITRAANSTKFTGANSSTNSTLKADQAGEYLFTWEYATKTLTVTYPALPVKYNVTVTATAEGEDVVTGGGEYTAGEEVTVTASEELDGWVFIGWTEDGEFVANDPEYTFVVDGDVELVAVYAMDLGENEVTDLVIDGDNMLLTGSIAGFPMGTMNLELAIGEYDEEEGTYLLTEESKLYVGETNFTFVDGMAAIDMNTNSAMAIVVFEHNGTYYYMTVNMSAAPAEPVDVVVTDATIYEENGILFLTAPWEGKTIKAELPATEHQGWMMIEIHEGEDFSIAMSQNATIATVDNVLTITGVFTDNFTGDVYNVTISGKLPVEEPVVKPEPTYTENKLNTYAFGLESELNDTALVVTYRLNNSNATSVNVLVYKGKNIVATVAGTTTIGVNTVAIPVADLPQGRMLTWSVEVNGTSVEAPTQEEKIYSFYHPSGLDIDNNPENATFGMLLINEGMHSVKGIASGYVSSNYGAGIFAFTPSLDLIPNGELPGYNGGIEFTNGRADAPGSTAYSPRRIRISEDGRIFVTSLNTDGNYLWEVNADNLNEWTSVFKGTLNDNRELITEDSAFIAAPNSGFDVKGAGENLQLAMYSVNLPGITGAAMSGFRLHEYNLGTATTWATTPSKAWVEGLYAINYTGTQVEYDNEGGLWIASYRGSATDANPGLVHINADGVEDAKLIWSNVRQAGIRFNKDFTKLVVAGNNGAAKKATIYAVSKDANGAPVLTEETVIDMAVVGSNLNDFAFDYAGNLYACGNSAEKLIGWAMPYSGQVVTPAAAKYAFHIGELLPDPAVVTEMVGVVKRAVQNGESTIVLTHETDGTPHIYEVTDGTILELLQNGVIARDSENAGDLLAISDIAITEDGKLIANNYMICQADGYVDAGYKRGETRIYIWNDLHDAPSILFTSKMSSNWFRSKQGLTMAVKGTSDNMEIFMTGIHATSAWARVSSYRVIDGVYVEPDVNHNDHYYFYDINDAIALETTVGTQYELNASPLGEMNWVLDAELINPTEIVESATNNVEIATSVALTEDLGKKYNGATYVTVGEQVLMVAPFATPDGKLNSVMILDITAGFDAPKYVDQLILEEAVEATAAATAVEVVEGEEANALLITLVADATIYSLEATLAKGADYQIYEDEITNMAFDLDNLIITGGPSTAYQVQVVLALGDSNPLTGEWQVKSESSVSIMGTEATFVEGTVFEVDAFAPSAKAIVRCEWNGQNIELHLTMSAAPMEATVVIVENAVVEVEKFIIFGDDYDYSLKMTGVWHNEEDGLDYPVLVEVPVYYPEATEPSEITSTVTVGGWEDDDPWLGFGEGTLTVTTVDGVVTAAGIVQNPQAGVAIDITISGKLETTALENLQVTVKPVKMIQNGQLIIEKDGVQYNANGAIVK